MTIKKELVKKFYLAQNPNDNSCVIEIINFRLTDLIIFIEYSKIFKDINNVFNENTYSYAADSTLFCNWSREYLREERNSKLNEILK